ncbi:MAG: [acyl-carrier-protein] S-malonyltransferase, partial [Bacteroidetes bacterium]|nr:[acyl-carrier-protein] S-malonyltransferase [Bacteroidota bacterium]
FCTERQHSKITSLIWFAGHSLGEFSALVANKTLSFEDGLLLVYKACNGHAKACNYNRLQWPPCFSLADDIVERICNETEGVVVCSQL